MLYEVIIAVYNENHTELINKNDVFFIVKGDIIYSYHLALKG
jgi:hypothetical protein